MVRRPTSQPARQHGQSTHGAADLGGKLESRRQMQQAKFAKALAEVDAHEFMDEDVVKPGIAMALDMQIEGTLPSTTSSRLFDKTSGRAINQSERAAARKIIEKNKEEHMTANKTSAAAIRMERAQSRADSQRPWTTSSSSKPWRPGVISPTSSEAHTDLPIERDDFMSPDSLEFESVPSASRMASPVEPPEDKNFEHALYKFYKDAEELEVDQRREMALHRRELEKESKRNTCARKYFELKHKKRETVIVQEVTRREHRIAFDVYKEASIQKPLEARQRKDLEELQKRQEAVQQQKMLHDAHRQRQAAHQDFRLRQSTLDRTCREMDKQRLRRRQLAETKAEVEENKQIWESEAIQLQTRRAFAKAQEAAKSEEEHRRMQFLLALKAAELEKEALAKQQHIQAQYVWHGTKQSIRRSLLGSQHTGQTVSTGLGHVSAGPSVGEVAAEEAAPEEFQSYQETLDAFEALTNQVRMTSEQVKKGLAPRKVSVADLPPGAVSFTAQDYSEASFRLDTGNLAEGSLHRLDSLAESAQQEASAKLHFPLEQEVRALLAPDGALDTVSSFAPSAESHDMPQPSQSGRPWVTTAALIVPVGAPMSARDHFSSARAIEEPLSARPPFSTQKLVSITDQVHVPYGTLRSARPTSRGVLQPIGDQSSLAVLRKVRQTGPMGRNSPF
mmetsp:Transcript_74068/g.130937  ORF Transcript_74068/g.130937 Transcript_74068/m.130937 type:complete len:676 (+) Transcript_74068:112-2139(+)